ncbi:MAG: sugar nucleotide-binding protein [Chloroflexota bacterium]
MRPLTQGGSSGLPACPHGNAVCRPSLVIHAAAWTDVDGCAREPELAIRRNGEAVRSLAKACVQRDVGLVLISTNEVFDGERRDGIGYSEDDPPRPINAYGVSKLVGEHAAQEAYGASRGLWVLRTAWLYGPPGNDFPEKIVAASDRRPPGDPALCPSVGGQPHGRRGRRARHGRPLPSLAMIGGPQRPIGEPF